MSNRVKFMLCFGGHNGLAVENRMRAVSWQPFPALGLCHQHHPIKPRCQEWLGRASFLSCEPWARCLTKSVPKLLYLRVPVKVAGADKGKFRVTKCGSKAISRLLSHSF